MFQFSRGQIYHAYIRGEINPLPGSWPRRGPSAARGRLWSSGRDSGSSQTPSPVAPAAQSRRTFDCAEIAGSRRPSRPHRRQRLLCRSENLYIVYTDQAYSKVA
jgi:hypothetical protein